MRRIALGSFNSLYYTIEYPVSALNVSLDGTYFAYQSTSSHRNNRFILHPRLFTPDAIPQTPQCPAPDVSLHPMRGECLPYRLTHKTGFREGTVQVMTSRTGLEGRSYRLASGEGAASLR